MLQYILALLTILVFLVLIVRKPHIETYVLFVIYAFPFLDLKLLPVFLGYIRVFDAISIVGFLVLFKDFISFSKSSKYPIYPILGILFCVFTIISGLQAEFSFGNYFFYYPIFTTFIFVRFLYLFLSNSPNNSWLVLNAFKAAYIFALIFVSAQIVFGLQISFFSELGGNVFNEDTGIIRYPGIFAESQLHGQFLAMGSYFFLINRSRLPLKKKFLNYFVFTVSFLFLLTAGSRSAMGGFLIGLIILFLFSSNKIKLYGLILGVMVAIVGALVIPSNNGILSRSDNIKGDLDFRQSIWEETFGIIQENPILGVGLGNFQAYTSKYNQDMYLISSDNDFIYFTQPENGYLKILVEHGAIAFGLFCLFFLFPFAKFWLNIFRQSANFNSIIIFAALFSWIIAFNTVYSFSDYRILLTVALLLTFLRIMPKNYTDESDNENKKSHY